jgi:hypothetical protein
VGINTPKKNREVGVPPKRDVALNINTPETIERIPVR